MCDVSGEVSIFVAFLSVSCVNVPLSWTGEFIQVDYFLVVVNDHNVWLLRSHTELRRDRTPEIFQVKKGTLIIKSGSQT